MSTPVAASLIFDSRTVTSASSLRLKQSLFMWCLGQLLVWAYANGVELTGKELLRSPEQAAANQKTGKGIARSLHLVGLAIDVALFTDTTGDGVPDYQTDTRAYQALGEYWEQLHPLCRWGGRFRRADGNHFSVTHDGIQ